MRVQTLDIQAISRTSRTPIGAMVGPGSRQTPKSAKLANPYCPGSRSGFSSGASGSGVGAGGVGGVGGVGGLGKSSPTLTIAEATGDSSTSPSLTWPATKNTEYVLGRTPAAKKTFDPSGQTSTLGLTCPSSTTI